MTNLETRVTRLVSGERYRETRLRNDLTVASLAMPAAKTVALGVWVPFGSKHEREGQRGWAHLLEHLLFKRTALSTAVEIAQWRDRYPEANALTDNDQTFYYLVCRPEDLTEAVDLLYELFAKAGFEEEDVVGERRVVFEEISMFEDSLEDRAMTLAHRGLYAGSSMERDPHGVREDLLKATAAKLHRMRAKGYVTSSAFLIAAGAVRHQGLLKAALATFGKEKRTFSTMQGDRGQAKPKVGLHTFVKNRIKQARLVHAFITPPASHPDFVPLAVFAEYFGQQESGPLYQEIRNRRGATYAAHCTVISHARYGQLTVDLGTKPARLGAVNTWVHQLLAKAAEQPMTHAQLTAVKARMEAKLRYELDSPLAILQDWADTLGLFGRFLPLEERLNSLSVVALSDVHRVVREYIVSPVVVAIAPESALVALRDSERAWSKKEKRRLREWQASQALGEEIVAVSAPVVVPPAQMPIPPSVTATVVVRKKGLETPVEIMSAEPAANMPAVDEVATPRAS